MKKQVLFILMMLLPMVASADVVEIDGVWYNINKEDYSAVVTYNPSYIRYKGDVVIPETVNYEGSNYTVNAIGEKAFSYCNELKSIKIPPTITFIGKNAFDECFYIKSVYLSDIAAWCGVKHEEVADLWSPFLYCGADLYLNGEVIGDLVIPEGVESICEGAFAGCKSIKTVTLPSSMNYVSEDVFRNCYNIETVVLPESITKICRDAFECCYSLSSINLPQEITSIEAGAFSNCSSLKTVSIPNGITTIESLVFYGCKSLCSIDIPNSVKKIDAYAFQGCMSLCSIDIPSSVEELEYYAFAGCTNLKSINIPNTLQILSANCFYGCSSLEHIDIPDPITTLGKQTFEDCTSLKSITIPNSVRTIGQNCFKGCSSLETISMPKSVNVIEPFAFSKCTSLSDVYCYMEKLSSNMSEYAFSESPIENATLHVPHKLVNLYNYVKPWKDFKSIVGIDYPKYTLDYYIDNELYKSYEIEEGETIIPEPSPTKEGYTFSGWSEIPEIMPNHDVIVTGTFTVNSYYLIYKIDNTVYKRVKYEYGATIIPEPQPEGDYATFEWIGLPETMPAHNVTVKASYTTDIVDLIFDEQSKVNIYAHDGVKLSKFKKGLNIVKGNGKIKKIIIK